MTILLSFIIEKKNKAGKRQSWYDFMLRLEKCTRSKDVNKYESILELQVFCIVD